MGNQSNIQKTKIGGIKIHGKKTTEKMRRTRKNGMIGRKKQTKKKNQR